MRPIVIVEDAELRALVEELRYATDPESGRPIYRLRFAIDDGTIKVKANEGAWSPPYGHVEHPADTTPAADYVAVVKWAQETIEHHNPTEETEALWSAVTHATTLLHRAGVLTDEQRAELLPAASKEA